MIIYDMWELQLSTSRRGDFSVRSIFTFVLAALVAAFLWTASQAPTTYAASAMWSGSSLIYEGNTYNGPANATLIDSLGYDAGSTIYTYTEPQGTADRKMHIIVFSPDIVASTSRTASYRTYDFSGPSGYTNPTNAVAIDIDPPPPSDATTSCAVDHGLGWIICPVTNTLANGMDWVFDILVSFLEVHPPETNNQENAMYRAWSYMRTFANIAFVISFLIIIYSQLTSIGISNYSIKKLLPRLIITAVVVNVSYFICALAIDISNFFGHSIQSFFISMRNSLVGDEGNSWEVLSFESVATFVLAGGTLAAAGGLAAFSAVAGVGLGGAIFLLLPTLVTGGLSVLVALAVMAARQALITILTIVAPLAFVLYLLPNTEQWFNRWRGIFMTMLLLFPAFSVVFGGSQLAAAVILQNAQSINVIILAMLVQVAPLLITPLLIRLSGSIISRLAGVINQPNRGLVAGARNFAKDRTEAMKQRRLATPARAGILGASQRAGQRADHRRRQREGWKNAYTAQADANWANSEDSMIIDQQNRRSADEKALAESISGGRYNISKVTDAEIQQLDVNVRNAKLDLENAQTQADLTNWEQNHAVPIMSAKLRERVQKDQLERVHAEHDRDYDDIRAGVIPAHMSSIPNITTYEALARDAVTHTKASKRAATEAQSQQARQYAEQIQVDTALQNIAGGISGTQGVQAAIADAKKTASKFLLDDIQTVQDTLSYGDATNNDGLVVKFKSATTLTERVAFARTVAKNGTPGNKALREMITHYDGTSPSETDLLDFKELLGMQSGVRESGKDIDSYITHARDDTTKRPKTLNTITNENSTWTNLSSMAWAAQNAHTQQVALNQLRTTDLSAYMNVVNMLRTSESVGGIKEGVRKEFSIYTPDQIDAAAAAGTPLPPPGTHRP